MLGILFCVRIRSSHFDCIMSRIGRQPVILPVGVTAHIDGQRVVINGPKGELSMVVHPTIAVVLQDGALLCSILKQTKRSRALWGTTRALLNNLVRGVAEGYKKQLELHGIGFRATVKGSNTLELSLGFSHPLAITAPENIRFSVEKELITVEGIDRALVGQIAADIHALRPPEPYKGKGVRYRGEVIRRKVGKVVGTTT